MHNLIDDGMRCAEFAHRQYCRMLILALAAVMAAVTIVSLQPDAAAQVNGATASQLPRFASLKASPVNLRTGPGRQYPKNWVFRRAGLPVEIIQIHGNWRRVRDAEGVSGWISQYLVSQRRTALVMPWAIEKSSTQVYVDLKLSAQKEAKSIARLEAGSLLNVKRCDGKWCHVSVIESKDDNSGEHGYSGYVEQIALWGVYPSERIS